MLYSLIVTFFSNGEIIDEGGIICCDVGVSPNNMNSENSSKPLLFVTNNLSTNSHFCQSLLFKSQTMISKMIKMDVAFKIGDFGRIMELIRKFRRERLI